MMWLISDYTYLAFSFLFFILFRRGLHRHVKSSSSLTPISDLSIPAINLPSTTSEEMETNIITTSELSPMGFHDKELEMTESKGNNLVMLTKIDLSAYLFCNTHCLNKLE